MELESSISIQDCEFEVDAKSTSSIYYVNGKKLQIPVDVKDCIFKGKLSKNAFHIDGFSNQKNKLKPNLRIEYRKFSADKLNALNSNIKLYSPFIADLMKSNLDEKIKRNFLQKTNWILILSIFVSTFALIIIIVISIKYSITCDGEINDNTNETVFS